MNKIILLSDPRHFEIPRGTRIVAKIQIKNQMEPKVMYLMPGPSDIGKLDEA